DEHEPIDPQCAEEMLDEVRQSLRREPEVRALGSAAKAEEVGCDTPRALERTDPVIGARRGAVQIEDRHGRMPSASIKDGRSAERDRVLLDAHGPARITSGACPPRAPRPAPPARSCASARRWSTWSASARS